MRRSVLVVFAVLVALPAVASHWGPLRFTEEAREELADLRIATRAVRDPAVRADLQSRIDHVDRLVGAAESELYSPPPAPALDFGDARAMVLAETFDDDKLEVLRRIGRTSSLTTSDARALADLCTFDSTKADALIALYPAVVDPQRFGLALDILTFSSTRREVEQALGL